jgi:hypothetical protein
MTRQIGTLIGLIMLSSSAYGLGFNDVAKIIEAEYPGANITEIERETYRGKKIFEVDFEYQGEKLEAIIGLDGKIIKVQIDD